MIEAGIDGLLAGSNPVSALVSNRIYALFFPEEVAMPALRYQIIGGSSQPTFSTSGSQKVRIQFDCYGDTYADAVGVRSALVEFLNGYQGALQDGTFLQYTELIQTMDFYEDQSQQCRLMAEFYLFFVFPS